MAAFQLPLLPPAQPSSEGATTVRKLSSAMAAIREEYLSTTAWPWHVGAGKDSTLTLQLVLDVLLSLPPEARARRVDVLSNDTLVETPVMASFVTKKLEEIRVGVARLGLPVRVVRTTPDPDQTFWVNLIGRGYPPPTRSFRWCTDRLKINPASRFVEASVAESGGAVLVLGVRSDESVARAASIARHTISGSRLNPHSTIRGCHVLRPIVDFTTEEVWQLLLQRPPPWGGSHRDLITLYRNAQGGGECPLVVERNQAPSCGSRSSRFGCWTCTVVEKDASTEGLVESGEEHLQPLVDFREWLIELRNQPGCRWPERRDGSTRVVAADRGPQARLDLGRASAVRTVEGPFWLRVRRSILERLHATQEAVGVPLITHEETERIHGWWAADAHHPLEAHADGGGA